eukprot:365344-Chlamydomonas_euryale.AAC.10
MAHRDIVANLDSRAELAGAAHEHVVLNVRALANGHGRVVTCTGGNASGTSRRAANTKHHLAPRSSQPCKGSGVKAWHADRTSHDGAIPHGRAFPYGHLHHMRVAGGQGCMMGAPDTYHAELM